MTASESSATMSSSMSPSIAGAVSGEWPPVAMNRLIANFAELKRKLEAAARGPGMPLAGVRLLTPVPWPSKVVAYPVNYHDHGAEMSVGYRANNQGFFLKPPSAISGPSDPIVLPVNDGRRIDHECELAIIIGQRRTRHPARASYRDYIFGYSCLIDAVIRGQGRARRAQGVRYVLPGRPLDRHRGRDRRCRVAASGHAVGQRRDQAGRQHARSRARYSRHDRDGVVDHDALSRATSSRPARRPASDRSGRATR